MLLVCPRWALHCERLRDWMESMCVSPTATGEATHLGVGFPCGILRGQTLAWTVLGGCAASLVDEGPVSL